MSDLLTEQELTQISQRISEIEARTDAEVVTVLAEQADDYYYIPTLWAALAGVVTPSVLILFASAVHSTTHKSRPPRPQKRSAA